MSLFESPFASDKKQESSTSDAESEVKIVQYSDESRLLPDGSKVIYAESNERIILHHKKNIGESKNYVFFRKSGKLMVNNEEGNPQEKKAMIELGQYFLSHSKDSDLVTVSVKKATPA